jgi:hypothetical protein
MKSRRLHPAAQGAPGTEEQAWRAAPVVTAQFGRVDRLHAVGDVDHPSRSDERLERDAVHGGSSRHEVHRRVDVRAAVRAHGVG